ncbi:hypothetical protein ACQ4LE_005554 [Meloidogyne hapla]
MSKALLLDDTFDEKDDEIGIRCEQKLGRRRSLTLRTSSADKVNERLSLQPATSTPSLSESYYGSATLLCRPDKQESQQSRKIDVFANIKKATIDSSIDDKSYVGCSPCTVNYDTFLDEAAERKGINNELIRKESENEHFILNPVFCDVDIEENIEKRSEEKIGLLKKENLCEEILKEEENYDYELSLGNIALSSRKSLISTKQRKNTEVAVEAGTSLQIKKQGKKRPSLSPYSLTASTTSAASQQLLPTTKTASTALFPSSSQSIASSSLPFSSYHSSPISEPKGSNSKKRRQKAGEMRLLGNDGGGIGGNGRQSTSVAPMSGGISDGPLDMTGFSGSAPIPSGKRVQAKQNQMYLITTMLPGTSSQQQQNGHTLNSQQQKHNHQNVPPALINRMLPTELILRVFSYLDITSLCRCAQVCRSWNKLSMDGSNWMDVDLFLFQREVKTSVVESLAKRCANFLKVLSLKGCENVQDNAMRSFATKCPNIERLTLTKCKLITDGTCEYIGRYCNKIVMVDLENCTLVTDIAIKFISEGCKRLEELNISWCEQITDLGLFYIAKNCINLKTLFCKGLDNITSNCFANLEMAELKRLSLHSCPNVLDETVNDIARHCPRLEFLSLSNCKEITDNSLVAISLGCPRLKDIELAGCINLTDAGFIQLSKNCHELERMDLEECLLITDITLSNLNNGCPNLLSLSLSHCENLTDIGLAELCASHKDRLQVLELDNCPNITDNTLESMKMLQVLERIDLYDCQMITKDAIKKFKQSRPGVEVHAYFAPATPPPQAPPARRGICRCCAIL